MNKYKTFWDSIAGENRLYQMGPQSHRVYALNLLSRLKVKSILDVGCGTGPIYELIKSSKKWKFDYKGTDLAEEMIKTAKFHFPEGNFEVQDARKLSEADASWDCVFIMHTLDHLDDYESVILEATRVSKKYVLIILWRPINYNKEALNNLNNHSPREEGGEYKDSHLQDYAWERLDEAFKKANLKLILKEDGKRVNKEGRFNTLILLEK